MEKELIWGKLKEVNVEQKETNYKMRKEINDWKVKVEDFEKELGKIKREGNKCEGVREDMEKKVENLA